MVKNLDKLTSEELGQLFPIIIVNPNLQWKNLFQQEKKKILTALGSDIVLRIEHIGSTAVPNLKAKPTIDILLEIIKDSDTKQIIESIKKCGYHFLSKPENPPPHMLFVKGYRPDGFIGQVYHIHVRYEGDWDEVHFRDYLIAHPQDAKAYETLKIELAKKFKHDRDGYTNAKSSFINHIMIKAKKK